MVNKIMLYWIFLLGTLPLLGQQTYSKLSLQEAYLLFEKQYPLLKDSLLLHEIYGKKQELHNKQRLPSVSLKSDGRIQSETVSFDLPPNSELPLNVDLPLYSVQTYVEATYQVLDGGRNSAQQAVDKAQHAVDLQQIAVNKYALRARVNQFFINIAMLRKQSKLFELSLQELQERRASIEAGVKEGILLPSELSRISVKVLEIKSQQDNVRYRIVGFINSLEELLGVELSPTLELVFPSYPNNQSLPSIERPELQLFELQQQRIRSNASLIEAQRKPQLGVFAQGGVGYPNPLNIFDNGTAIYGIAGFKFSWALTDWNQSKLNKQILDLNAQKVQHAQETFEFNLKSQEANYFAEKVRLEQQIQRAEEIATLQNTVLQQVAVQLDEGVITTAEYVAQVNEELRARQNILIYQTELLKLQVEFWNERAGQ